MLPLCYTQPCLASNFSFLTGPPQRTERLNTPLTFNGLLSRLIRDHIPSSKSVFRNYKGSVRNGGLAHYRLYSCVPWSRVIRIASVIGHFFPFGWVGLWLKLLVSFEGTATITSICWLIALWWWGKRVWLLTGTHCLCVAVHRGPARSLPHASLFTTSCSMWQFVN